MTAIPRLQALPPARSKRCLMRGKTGPSLNEAVIVLCYRSQRCSSFVGSCWPESVPKHASSASLRIQIHNRIPMDNTLHTVVGCLALLLAWQAGAAAGKEQPIDVIKTATQNIVTELNAKPAIRTNVTELRRLVEQNIIPRVDLAGLSRLTLGKYWREATPQQRQTFEGELHTLLTRTYSASMSRYRNQSVEYVSPDIAPNKRMARVRTRILAFSRSSQA